MVDKRFLIIIQQIITIALIIQIYFNTFSRSLNLLFTLPLEKNISPTKCMLECLLIKSWNKKILFRNLFHFQFAQYRGSERCEKWRWWRSHWQQTTTTTRRRNARGSRRERYHTAESDPFTWWTCFQGVSYSLSVNRGVCYLVCGKKT